MTSKSSKLEVLPAITLISTPSTCQYQIQVRVLPSFPVRRRRTKTPLNLNLPGVWTVLGYDVLWDYLDWHSCVRMAQLKSRHKYNRDTVVRFKPKTLLYVGPAHKSPMKGDKRWKSCIVSIKAADVCEMICFFVFVFSFYICWFMVESFPAYKSLLRPSIKTPKVRSAYGIIFHISVYQILKKLACATASICHPTG